MPSTIIPFDANTSTPNGTWTYVGSLSGAPAAPGTYNGQIDFDGVAPGDYDYQYAVTWGSGANQQTDISVVSIRWTGDQIAPANDTCAGAFIIGSGLLECPQSVFQKVNNALICADQQAAPTDSGQAQPAQWTLTGYNGDLWYKIIPPACTSNYQLQVVVSGLGSANDAKGIGLEVLVGSCVSLTSVEASTSNANSSTVGFSVNVAANQNATYFIRIASVTPGNMGITVSCNSQCNPGIGGDITYYISDAAAAAGGVDIGEVYYLAQGNIYGESWGSPKLRTT